MNVRLIEQLIELNAVVKPYRREFKSWSWNIYIGIIVFIFLHLFFIIIFIVHVFILFIYCIISLVCVFFVLFRLFVIYVLNILEYMNRQQQPGKTALICCRDVQADLGLRTCKRNHFLTTWF